MVSVSKICSSNVMSSCYFKSKKQEKNSVACQPRNLMTYAYQPVNFRGVGKTSPLNDSEKKELFDIISGIDEDKIKYGSLGKVYKVRLPERGNLAVKEFREVVQGRTPQIEAETLKKLPEDCGRVQKFVDLISDGSGQYLVSTFMEGEPLSKLKDRMPNALIKNILDELFKIEKSGLAFYDYSMANIVFQGDEPGFFDFETAKEQSFSRINEEAWGDLCHLSRNTYYPFTTNLAGFEIRTVGKIIGELEKYAGGEYRSTNFTKRYLIQASEFFRKMTQLLQEKGNVIPSEAVNYSQILSELFQNPSSEVVFIEEQSMRIKELLTEFWFRNDADLDNDEILYSNGEAYVKNLKARFNTVQNALTELKNSTTNGKILEYCKVNSEFLHQLSDKEVTYLSKKFHL